MNTPLTLNERSQSVKGSKILVLGIAYKKNIDDSRESPAIELMELLRDKGADVAYSDPFLPVFPKKRTYQFNLTSVALTAESIASYDCVLIATNHDAFDYTLIQQYARLIVDTRGVYLEQVANVVRA